MIESYCTCGEICFETVEGDYLLANCHCSICRKTSADRFVAWLTVFEGSNLPWSDESGKAREEQ